MNANMVQIHQTKTPTKELIGNKPSKTQQILLKINSLQKYQSQKICKNICP